MQKQDSQKNLSPLPSSHDLQKQQKKEELVVMLKELKRSLQRCEQTVYVERREKLLLLGKRCGNYDQTAGWLLEQYVRVSEAQEFGKLDDRISLTCQEEQLMKYWKQCSLINEKPSNEWDIRSHLWTGQSLIHAFKVNQAASTILDKSKVIANILINNAVDYYRLQMFQESLLTLQAVDQLKPDKSSCENIQKLRILLHTKMGMDLNQLKFIYTKRIENIKMSSLNLKQRQFLEFSYLIRLTNEGLACYIQDLNEKRSKIHIYNYYNIALLCKRNNMMEIATTLLEGLVNESKGKKRTQIHTKSLVLLSQINQENGNLQAAISFLDKIEDEDVEISKQIHLHKWYLKKKLKLRNNTNTCPEKSLNKNRKYLLLQGLEGQLNKLINKQNTLLRPKKTKHLTSYQKKVKDTVVRVAKQKHLTTTSMKQSILSRQNSLKTSEQRFASKISTPRSNKKGVFFIQKNMDEELLTDVLFNSEETIMTYIIEQKFQQALSEIETMVDQLEDLQKECQVQVFNFRMKCVNWCRQLGKEKYTILLLKKFIARYKNLELPQYLIIMLNELSKIYEQLTEYKNAIDVNVQLYQLGQIQSLDKIGEMHLLRENYSQSLKYYERYHQIKHTLYSQVKLAHAYSKIASYNKKAIEILNDLIFENKTSCIFKKFNCEDINNVQNAVLLLSTIYMNMNGTRKAIEICQQYLNQNFGAYPIFYLLGVMQYREGDQDKAFSAFLSAIRLKPNHLPSLIEIVNYVGTSGSYNQQILDILRKAFLLNHRDWNLLQLLIEVITKVKRHNKQVNIPNLIEYARILEEDPVENGLLIEAEAVWLWAMEIMQERRKRVSVLDHEYAQTIYVRLGEINLQKGNYPASEIYFKRILQKIEMERMRAKYKSKENQVKLQIEILRRMAFIKGQQHNMKEAIKYLEQSIDIANNNSLKKQADEDHRKIAYLYLQFGYYCQSIEILKQLTDKIDIRQFIRQQDLDLWIEIKHKMAECYIGLQKIRQAKRTYQSIIKRKMNEKAIIQLSKIYRKEGNLQWAEELTLGWQEHRTMNNPPIQLNIFS